MKSPSYSIAKRKLSGIGEEPIGDNYDSDTLRKSFCMDSYRLRAALGLRGVGGKFVFPLTPLRTPLPPPKRLGGISK